MNCRVSVVGYPVPRSYCTIDARDLGALLLARQGKHSLAKAPIPTRPPGHRRGTRSEFLLPRDVTASTWETACLLT